MGDALGDERAFQPDKILKHANITGEQFHKLYYDAIDKRRHLLSKLYMDSAVLCWNGNAFNKVTDIHNFYLSLAKTQHTLAVVDSIPIPSVAVGKNEAIIVQAGGTVKLIDDSRTIHKTFTQTFILAQQEGKWKIASDTFRTQNGLNATSLYG